MDRLIAFGCSDTFGTGLEHPSHGWPAILAEEFNLNLINKAIPGSSVKRTTFTIQEFEFAPNDQVVILWPFYTRMWFNTPTGHQDNLITELQYDTSFYKEYFDDEDQLFSNYCFITTALKKINTYCEKQPWMILHDPECMEGYTKYGLKFIDILYREYYDLFPSTACGHTNHQGQRAFALDLIHYLKPGKYVKGAKEFL